MSQTSTSAEQEANDRGHGTGTQAQESWFARGYRIMAYFGLMSVFAALVQGFRFDPTASAVNYLIDVALYAVFVVPHLIMTRSWLKQALWGDPSGSLRERRMYITIAIVMWLAILLLQQPLPGPYLEVPRVVNLVGYVGALWSVLLFFQGSTREGLDGLLGVPGSLARYSHGPETPLFTEGPYTQVRHPMYRAAILAGLSTLLIYPNAAQLIWCGMVGGTFIAFIPIEEAQLRAARGEDYRRYCEQTPYRLFRWVW
jgi:protein-S-isoprenylcysteine O-methyltransferase Ste14